ncbi:hypothetical protein [Mesorhizobium sp. A556]
MVKALTLAALLAVAGCQTPKASFCTVASPIRPSASTIATMTDAEIRDVLAHNVKGAKLCGWHP